MAEILEFAIFVTYRPDPAHLFPSVHFDEYETHYPTRDTTVFHRWRMTSTFTLPCFIRGSRPTSPYLSLPAKIIVFARVRADPSSRRHCEVLRKKNCYYYYYPFCSVSPYNYTRKFLFRSIPTLHGRVKSVWIRCIFPWSNVKCQYVICLRLKGNMFVYFLREKNLLNCLENNDWKFIICVNVPAFNPNLAAENIITRLERAMKLFVK